MQWNRKIIWPVITTTVLLFTSLASGALPSQNAKISRKEAVQRANGMINPPARPCVRDGIDLFLRGEFLYWKAQLDDLQYGALVTDTFDKKCCQNCDDESKQNENQFLASTCAKLQEPNFKTAPGFRLGIGTNMAYDGWDLVFLWTRLHTNAQECTLASCPSNCVCNPCCKPSCFNPCDFCCNISSDCCKQCLSECGFSSKHYRSSPNPLSCCTKIIPAFAACRYADDYATTVQASACWKLKLDLLDLELGREFFVSRFLTLRPHLGLRGGLVKQAYTVNYNTELHIDCPKCSVYVDVINDCDGGSCIKGCQPVSCLCGCELNCNEFRNKFKGIGPRFGINSDWLFSKGFGIYGKAAISLLYGSFDLDNLICKKLCGVEGVCPENLMVTAAECKNVCECSASCLCDDFNTSKAITDLVIGLQWQETFSDDTWGLRLQIGWEHHMLFEQNQILYLETQKNINALAHPNGDTYQLDLTPRRRGSLSVQGLTLSAQVDF